MKISCESGELISAYLEIASIHLQCSRVKEAREIDDLLISKYDDEHLRILHFSLTKIYFSFWLNGLDLNITELLNSVVISFKVKKIKT